MPRFRTLFMTAAVLQFGWLTAATGLVAQVPSDTTSLITISAQGVPLSDAIEQVIEKTGIDIAYDPDLVNWKRADCTVTASQHEDILHCVLAGTGLTFRKMPSGVYILMKEEKDDDLSSREGRNRGSYTISGFMQDATTGEKFVGANVYAPDRKIGTASNLYGFYSLTLPADSTTIVFSYIGYTTVVRDLSLDGNKRLDIALNPSTFSSAAIEVVADRFERIEEKVTMSTVEIPIRQVKSMPTVLGETDLIKAFQLMPGVRSGSEGMSGLYVRGGSPDQTLVLLDGATVYNVSHLFGLFSVFNPDAVSRASLMKGGFPARYGGRLSSVLDVGMKEGNLKRFGGEVAIGAVASRFMVEGPIQKDKTSFIVSGRRTYVDALYRPFQPDDERAGMYFYDLNAKINHALTSKDRLFFSVYRGNDRYSGGEREPDGSWSEAAVTWGNITSTFRWNRLVSSKLFSNVTANYTNYNFDISIDQQSHSSGDGVFKLNYFSGIQDWSIKADFDYLPSASHVVRFGIHGTQHTFSPGAQQIKVSLSDELTEEPFSILPADKIDASEYALYVEDDVRLSNRFRINVGLHGSGFLVEDSHYNSIQPRISARYLTKWGWALKVSAAVMRQYILLLSNSTIGLPTDLWLPATNRVPPQDSQQLAAGLSSTVFDNQFEISIEGYYKRMQGLIEYKNGAGFIGLDQDWQNKIEFGDGESYGAEFLLQKKTGRTTGWIGYTLSWSNRTFDELNLGRTFAYRYDGRHDVAVVVLHNITPDIEISGNWVYTTGNAVTLPTTVFYAHSFVDSRNCNGCVVESYDKRSNYRQSPHHRLDIGVNFHKSTPRGRVQTISIGAYNAYNRKNVFFIDAEDDGTLTQFSLFPVIPYVTYRRSF